MVAAVLHVLEMNDWIAASTTDYVTIAQKKAQAREELGEMRKGLRDRMLQSALCDAGTFTKALEQKYLQLAQTPGAI